MGLGGFVMIIALLYFTGAGKWLWARMLELEGQCYTMLAEIGSPTGGQICSGMGSAIGGIDRFFSDIDGSISNFFNSIGTQFQGAADIPSAVGNIRLTSALSRLGSSTDELAMKLRVGPQSLSLDSMQDQIRSAVDSFAIGQRYMGGDGSSAYRALPWLQKGAQVPGYGVLSQLSLGDMYRAGNGGVSLNPKAAASYYSQAHQSIDILQSSNTPQAQSILKALPASPEEIQQQLLRTIRDLKAGQ